MGLEEKLASFLGRGWAFPLGSSGTGRLALAAEAENVRQSILLVLETAPGERPMRPDFGCGIHRLVFEPMNHALKTLVKKDVEDALVKWEPRIDVRQVSVAESPTDRGRLLIDIRYLLRATNTFYNLVYPFYLQEQRA